VKSNEFSKHDEDGVSYKIKPFEISRRRILFNRTLRVVVEIAVHHRCCALTGTSGKHEGLTAPLHQPSQYRFSHSFHIVIDSESDNHHSP
jgi:hypothetical protein